MELSERFVNTVRMFQGQDVNSQSVADWSEVMDGWLPHILLDDDADFSWASQTPMLTNHVSVQKLAQLDNPAKLLVFKDMSGVVIGTARGNNQIMSFMKNDLDNPVMMAIMCVASARLQMALNSIMNTLDEGEPNTPMSGAGQECP